MEKETIENWYRRYGPMVLRRCRGLLGDEADAYDAMQEVFMQVLGKHEQIRDEFPSSFLYRTATNICLNKIRAAKRFVSADEKPSLLEAIANDCDPTDRIAAGSVLDMLFKAGQQSTRVMAVYHFVDGLTLEETASEMGMSVSGVRKRLRQLKKLLHQNGFIEEEFQLRSGK